MIIGGCERVKWRGPGVRDEGSEAAPVGFSNFDSIRMKGRGGVR